MDKTISIITTIVFLLAAASINAQTEHTNDEFIVDGIIYSHFGKLNDEACIVNTDILFENCRLNGQKHIVIPSTVKDNEGNELAVTGAQMSFEYDDNIESIIMPEALRYLWGCFYKCSALKHVDLGRRMVQMASQNFIDVPQLKSVVFPETLECIGSYCFQHCGFEQLEIPARISIFADAVFTYLLNLRELSFSGTKLGLFDGCFYALPYVEKLDFSKISSISIYPYCFSNMPNLKEIWLPAGIGINPTSWFDVGAFRYCDNLEAVYNPNSVPTAYSESESDSSQEPLDGEFDKSKVILYVPLGAAEIYRADKEWSKFPDIREYDFETAKAAVIRSDNAPIRFYNLQGTEVRNPKNGIFIEVKGNARRKVRF